ncbi:MAG: DUF1743 domain-containing protein [Candidatus Hydrothermarchaeales archaeon]
MLHIGIDDTDSLEGMCTTYIGAVLADELSKFAEVSSLKLVRLNPNIKWKTRGNGSVSLGLKTKEDEKVKEIVLDTVERYSEFACEDTNPGVVFFEGEIPEDFKTFYCRALHGIVDIAEAERLAESYRAEVHKFKNGRGVIGAIAAIGSDLRDHTHEIIAYRNKRMHRSKRRVDEKSVFEMDKATQPLTYNNVDYENSRVLITPRTPCPVLFGIRGESEDILRRAFEMVEIGEEIERAAIFETNQCTDVHLEKVPKISEVRPYSSIIVEGTVKSLPKTLSGGHVIFSIMDFSGEIDCAAYEPTGSFRSAVKRLIPGDIVKAYGGVKDTVGLTVNLEKLEILELANFHEERNPLCPKCGKRMKSAGKDQGFRCRRCKTYNERKESIEVERGVVKGIHQVPPRAMRHLSKPLARYTTKKGGSQCL